MVRMRRGMQLPSSVVAGVTSAVVLGAAYLATAAPDLTVWDASELVTAARTLGIPHPPGTPLWVLTAHVISMVFNAAGPVRSVTLLSVCATALAGGLGAAMISRWIGARGAVVAAVSAGGMMSVWNNATEAEVYALSLLLSVAMLYAGERAGRHEVLDDVRSRWRALLVFLAALSIPMHLSACVAFPAAALLAWRGARPTARDVLVWTALALLALSAIAVLPIRSHFNPLLDSGHPVTLRTLFAVLQREQYAVAGLLPRRAPVWLQLGNVLEWADWQVAFGLHPFVAPSWTRTSLSILWVWLAFLGVKPLWRHDPRVARAMLLLLVSGTVGVAVWLNMHVGPSFGIGIVPGDALHEARERDYFFVLGFWAWGILAGAGLLSIATKLSRRMPAALASSILVFGAVPLVANGPVLDRHREPIASLPRVFARLLLDAVPTNGVLVTAGDNDTFPLWYLQQVEGYRTDVSIVTAPLLGAQWYREQLARRDELLPVEMTTSWSGLDAALSSVAARARSLGRPLRVSALVDRAQRNALNFTMGWALEGLVYQPSALIPRGTVGLDHAALARARELVPPSSLATLPSGADGAVEQIQALLRCTRITTLTDPLLVSACNGL